MGNQSVPPKMQGLYDQITAMTDEVCLANLDQEFLELCRDMTAALCRKREPFVVFGAPVYWACAIVATIARVNFSKLRVQHFLPRVEPGDKQVTQKAICEAFGVGTSTCATKMTTITQGLRMKEYDHKWTLPSLLIQDVGAWSFLINGVVVDLRKLPVDVQEKAVKVGLIPFSPATYKRK